MERGRRIEGGMEEERKGDKYLGRDKPHNISEIESRTGSWKLVISNKHEVAISAPAMAFYDEIFKEYKQVL